MNDLTDSNEAIEIIAALRDAGLYFKRQANSCRGTVIDDCLAAGYDERAATQRKAADMLEALQARVRELEVESRRLGEALDFHTDNIEPQMRETITQKDAEIARLHT